MKSGVSRRYMGAVGAALILMPLGSLLFFGAIGLPDGIAGVGGPPFARQGRQGQPDPTASSREGNPMRPIRAGDKFRHRFSLSGVVFLDGNVTSYILTQVTTSLVHSFSPATEENFRAALVDPLRHEQRIYANSPAMIWTDSGKLVVIMRMWLEKEKLKLAAYRASNVLSDNYFYTQLFNDKLDPLTPGQTMGIPTKVHVEIGDGPIEPRIFSVNNHIYVTFNTGAFVSRTTMVDTTFIWDYEQHVCIVPSISGGQPMTVHHTGNRLARDKHWSAFTYKDRLYFVYNLDPLRVMHCSMPAGNCNFVHFEGPRNYTFTQSKDTLRGGTPFVLYRHPYYLSIAHGTLFRDCARAPCDWNRFYTANLVVMSVLPVHRIVYVSGDIHFHPSVAASIPIVRYRYIRYPFIFPVSLILEDYDTIAIGGHISDYSSVILRLRGLKSIMQQIEEAGGGRASTGPPIGSLHRLVKQSASNETGFKFRY